jgi:YVTN family beta-propeller protein
MTLGDDAGRAQLDLDASTGRLFIAHGARVLVVDPVQKQVLREITELHDARATAFTNGRAYISERGNNKVAVFNTNSFAKLAEIPVGKKPDKILYDSASGNVIAFNTESGDASVIDPADAEVVGTVRLNGEPTAATSDGKGDIFVNLGDTNELLVFDAFSLRTKARYPLVRCDAPHGIAVDIAHWLVFSGCANGVIAVTGMYDGNSVATIPSGIGPGDVRYDPIMKRLFGVNSISGTLTITREVNPLKFSLLGTIATALGAEAMEQDPKTHRLYVITLQHKPGGSIAAQAHPPSFTPGAVRLLFFEL